MPAAARKLAFDRRPAPDPVKARPVLRRIDLEAEAALVLEYRPLVERIVQQTLARVGHRCEADELRSAGDLGLVEAIRRFDPSRGIPFGGFARHRIVGAILDELRAKDPLGRPTRQRARGVERARQRLVRKLKRDPTEEELARASGEDLETFRRKTARERSQGTVLLEDLPAGSWEDLFPSREPDALENLCEAERRRRLAAAVTALPGRLQKMLAMYYDEELSLKDIGAAFGVCESRICQLLKGAQRELRTALA